MNKIFYTDLHVHIGMARDKPIKITASRKLTIDNIINESYNRKGLNIIGLVDCCSTYVIDEIISMINNKILSELDNGGLNYFDKLTLILGAEIETKETNKKNAHCLCFFPYLNNLIEFSRVINKYVKNINIGCPKVNMPTEKLLEIVHKLNGIFIPAHIFTPFKGYYGSVCDSFLEIMNKDQYKKITAIELGLSADANLATQISELDGKLFLTNSDAHSLSKIAREYNVITLEKPNFYELKKSLNKENGSKVKANYGLNPKLGKYYRTRCKCCDYISSSKILNNYNYCPSCYKKELVTGVFDRIYEIKDSKGKYVDNYNYQIPLEFIPKIGNKTINKIINTFGSEMNVLHNVDLEALKEELGEKIANDIYNAKIGKYTIDSGGGGEYGSLKNIPL